MISRSRFNVLHSAIRIFFLGCLTFTGNSSIFAQTAPNISYTTPQVLVLNVAASLSPTNSGGTVPAGTYRNVTTLAGSTQGFTNNTGTSAQFNRPVGVTIDSDGNLYVADTYNHRIRKVTPAGVVTTIAGDGSESFGWGRLQNGNGTYASFNYPTDIAIHPDGSCLYVADKENDVVRRISLTSPFAVTTFAGTGTAGFADHATTGTSAQFNQPEGIFYDNSGSTHYIYVADRTNHRIRRITLSSTDGVTATAGQVTTVAGTGGTTFANGTAGQAVSHATFNQPVQLAVSGNGTAVYIADFGNHRVRLLNLSTNTVTTLAGSGSAGGSDNATGTSATFNQPYGIEIDGEGNLVVSEQSGHRIRRISQASTNAVTTLAGSTSGTSGSNNAIGTSATFNTLQGMVFDPSRALLYACDFSNNRIREIEMSGFELSPSLPAGLSMAAGTGVISGTPTALSSAANYTVTAYNHYGSSSTTLNLAIANLPTLTTTSVSSVTTTGGTTGGNITADGGSAVTARGVVYGTTSGPTIAGLKTTDGSGTGSFTSSLTGLTPNTTYYVRAYATTAAGTAYGTEQSFTTLLNPVVISYASPTQTLAVGTPVSITLSSTGGAPDKVQVSTLAGITQPTFVDGTGTTARFSFPTGVAMDGSGVLYVADYANRRIRKITNTSGSISVSTLAGSGATGFLDATGTAAIFANPYSVAVDGSGDILVVDQGNHRLRKVTPAGVVTTLAGTGAFTPFSDGTSATFNSPGGVAVDGTGTIYIADRYNNRIRKITSVSGTTTVSTLAGTSASGNTDATGAAASFNSPAGISVDVSGNIYVADVMSHRIRKITPAGVVTTLAGSSQGSVDGTGTGAKFNGPAGIAVDGSGNVYVADYLGNMIRKVTPSGMVSTVAGSVGRAGFSDGTGTNAVFNYPTGICLDASGNIYVADQSNHRIRLISGYRIDPALPAGLFFDARNGTISGTPTAAQAAKVYTIYAQNAAGSTTTTITLAIESAPTVATTAATNVTGTTATLNGTVNANGGTTRALTIKYSTVQATVDAGNGTAASVTPASVNGSAVFSVSANITGLTPNTTYYYRVSATTSVGITNGTTMSFITGPNPPTISYSTSTVSLPVNTAMTPMAISGGADVELMQVSTIAGTGTSGFVNIMALSSRFSRPRGVCVDAGGNIYVADRMNHQIRKISTTGVVTTLAGSGTSGVAEGTGAVAQFNEPIDMVIDASGNLYVATHHRIMKITPLGVVTTWVGSTASPAVASGSSDGTGTNARFFSISGLGIDAAGNIYVCEIGNHLIRKVTPAGVVTTIAGAAGSKGSTNGTGASARFNNPDAIAVDPSGIVYVGESGENRIRKLVESGGVWTVSTHAGGTSGYVDGPIASAQFAAPGALTCDASGNLYVGEANRIRKISTSGMVSTIAGGSFGTANGSGSAAQFIFPRGFTFDQQGNLYLSDTESHIIRKITRFSISPALPAGLSFNTATGEISGTPTALSSPTTYTVTAANAGGTSTTTFTLEVSSTLLTADASAITETGATSGGTVDATVFAGATQKGVCWNTTGTPTISDPRTTDGSGTGTFTSTLTGLTPNTTYYLRSYVTVGSTTTYGNQKTFKTNELGTFADITKTFGDAKFSLTAPTAVSTGAFSFASSNTGVASVTPAGEVTIAGAGSSTITATQAAAGAYASATKTLTLTVNKGTPTITLSVPTTTALNQVTGSNTINVSGTSSDGQTVTMSIVSGGASGTLTSTATPGVFTLSNVGSSGIITFEGAVSGNTNMNAATKQAAMDVTLINQVISFTPTSPLTYAAGLTQTLTATGGGSGNAVTFTRESGPGSVAGTTLTVTGPGTIVVKASQAGNGGTHNAAPDVTRSIVVTPAAPVVSGFTPTSATQGEVVTITGQYFDNVTAVSFGGTAATSFNVVSATQITAVVGTGSSGLVSVTTTGGTHTKAGFRYKVTWTGATNTFTSTGNWSGGRVPQTDDDIVFSSTAASDLHLDNLRQVGNVDFNGSGRSIVLNGFDLVVKGNMTMPGNITGSGKVSFTGTSPQTITGGGSVPELMINNSTGVTLDPAGGELNVQRRLWLLGGTLTTNDKLRLVSNSGGTARVPSVSGTISGLVIAERYVKENQNSGGTGRAWRLVSVPVTGTGILRDFFMNGRNGQDLTLSASRDAETDNSGTPIVGHNYATASDATSAAGGGFDWIGVANSVSSLRYYTGDAAGGSFASENVPTMTTDYANAAQGYMVFTRGDRKLDFPDATTCGPTTFRSTGTLKTGNQTVSVAPAATSKYTLVGNPYMSILDLDEFYTTNSAVIEPSFWIWDANMAGTNKQGGYVNVYLSGGAWVTNTGSYIDPQLIESGMAFFVEPKTTLSSATNITISESHKSTELSAGMAPFSGTTTDDHGRLWVRLERADAQGQRQLIDGVMADFHSSFKTSLGDQSDREKLRNGISRGALWLSTDQKILSSEGLPWPTETKRSIPLYMSGVGDQTLIVRVDPRGMRDRYVQAWLKDNVLKRQVEINMSTPTDYDFIGTGSAAWDSTRFEIVYVEAGRPSTGVTLEPDDAAEQPSVKLYPNPSKSSDVKLSLRAMAPGAYSVQVLDMTGRLVATSTLNHRSVNGEYRILEGRLLSSGTYIIRLSDQNKQPKETLRLVVE